jgi:hypothetical protein
MTHTSGHWHEVSERHAATLGAFLEQAAALDHGRWLAPVEEGKWSPAEITEHLRLAYEVLGRELTGGTGLKPRAGKILQWLLRRVFLPRILRSGRIARKVQAPREIRPLTIESNREKALERLRVEGEQFEKNLAERSGTGTPCISHHLFGTFDAETGLRFVTIHLENHRRQLPS